MLVAFLRAGLLLLAVAAPVQASDLGPFDQFQIIRAPQDASDVDRLIEASSVQLARIEEARSKRDAARLGEPQEDERHYAAVESDLLESFSEYRALLVEYGSLQKSMVAWNESSSGATLAGIAAALQSRLDELKSGRSARTALVTDLDLSLAEKEWNSANDDLMVMTESRSERLRRLADRTARQEELAASVKLSEAALQDELRRYEDDQAATVGDSVRSIAGLRARRAHVLACFALLKEVESELRSNWDALQIEAAEQSLPIQREIVSLLDERLERWNRVRQRSERQEIRETAEDAAAHPEDYSAFEGQYWRTRMLLVDAQTEVEDRFERADVKDRFSAEKHADLMSDVAREISILHQFVASLDRRPREQIEERYRGTISRIRDWLRISSRLRSLYDASFDDRSEIELRLDEWEDRIRSAFRALRDPDSRQLPPERLAELRNLMGEHKGEVDAQIRDARSAIAELCSRLSEGVKAVELHTAALSQLRSRMYWSYLMINDRPVWRYRLSKSMEEWNSEARRESRESNVKSMRDGLRSVSIGSWMSLALAVGAGATVGKKLRRISRQAARRWSDKLMESTLSPPEWLDRFRVFFLRVFAASAPYAIPILCVLGWLSLSPMYGRIVWPVLAFALAARVAHDGVRVLFDDGECNLSLIRMEPAARRSWRRWLLGQIWFAAIVIPIPLALMSLGWAFYTWSYTMAFYKIALLISFLVFASKKQRVLAIVPESRTGVRGVVGAMVHAGRPFVYLVAIGLLLVQITGYSALTTYVVTGLAGTFASFVVAAVLCRCLQQGVARWEQRAQERTERSAAELRSDEERAAALSAGREVAMVVSRPGAENALSLGLLRSVLHLFIWMCSLVAIVSSWGLSWVELQKWLDVAVIAASGDRPAVSAGRGVMAILAVMSGWTLSRSIRSILESRVYPTYAQLDRGGRVAVNTMLHYFLLLVGVYFSMYLLRIPLGAVTVLLGTVGLGLGLASQPLFMNFLSGIIMLFERHVKVGDIVDVDGMVGEVSNISIRATTIKSFDNIDVIIPNADFISKKVVNWTLRDMTIRGRIDIGVAYGADPRKVERLLLQVASESALVRKDPPPRVRFTNFGENSLDFSLYAWFNNPSDRWDFITDGRFRIVELFEQNGIEIPYPQRTLSIKDTDAIRVQVVQP